MDFQIDDDPSLPVDRFPNVPMIFEDSHVATTPLGGQYRVGSTMQLTGYDRKVDPKKVRMIHGEAQKYLRNPLPDRPITTWAGWRPMMADDVPGLAAPPLPKMPGSPLATE